MTTTTTIDPLSVPIVHQQIGTYNNHPGVSMVLVLAIIAAMTIVCCWALFLRFRYALSPRR